MVATAGQMNERINANLHAIEAELDDLPDVVAEWYALNRDAQVDIIYDWHEVLGGYEAELCRLQPSMTADQRARYQTLLRRLDEARPLFQQLGIERPLFAQESGVTES